jgi:hypothetical protein
MEMATIHLVQQFENTSIFQVANPDMYYVNHLSDYEHKLRRLKRNFTYAIEKASILAFNAYSGECPAAPAVLHNGQSHLALIPFFGGLPPNTTSQMKVESLGEGNSVVNRTTKAIQCMATACSLLKYFNRVVIGVNNAEDEAIVTEHVR